MLKLYRNVLTAGVVALGLAACGDKVTVTNPPTPTPVVHSVTVVPASVTLTQGQTATFVASVVADSGLSSGVSWSSTAAATILTITTNSSGQAVVTAVGAGQATIIATSSADPTKTGAGSVSVQALPPNIVAFSVNPTNANIAVGGTLQVNPSVTVSPGAPAATITYATSSAATATVGASGQITGVSNGTAIITATATSGTQTATATVGVTVGTGPQGVVSFSVTPSAMTLFATQSQQATATVVSPGFTYPVTWTSLAPSVATVNSTGLITAVAQGSAVVTATIGTAPNTLTQSVVVTVAQGASISIAAINAGATAGTVSGCAGVTGSPVIITNVNCQIDVVLNLNAGVQPLDSLNVYMQHGIVAAGAPTFDGKATPVCAAASAPCPFFKRAGSQSYGNTIPSSGPVNISINTANFTKNVAAGTAVVDWYNGPAGVISQVFPHLLVGGQVTDCQIGAADQRCASINTLVFNNTDGWAADVAKCTGAVPVSGVNPTCPAAVTSVGAGVNTSTGGFAIDASGASANVGKTYWGGPGTTGEIAAELYAVVYNDNPGFPSGSSLNRCNNVLGNGAGCITTVSWTIGSTSVGFGHCDYVSQSATNTPGTPIFHQTFGTSGTGLTNNCGGHENVLARRDNILIAAGALDAQNNSFAAGSLIPNIVAGFATPDSFRIDWNGPSNVQRPTGDGWEEQHWVNASWQFNHDGTEVDDAGVGPAPSTWTAFVGPNYTTVIHSGADLAETNTNTSDGYTARAMATDLLGNSTNSAVNTTFGVDKTTPSLRYSTTAAPSSYASIYTGGGAATVLDSTTYNAFQGVNGTNITTAGAQDLFVCDAGAFAACLTGPLGGRNDSVRAEATDNRSGLFRGIETVNRFAQGGATGATSSIVSSNFTILDNATPPSPIGFLPGTIDGWLPLHAEHVTGGSSTPGYYTTTAYVVDKAGNASGCPVTRATDGANGAACTAAPASGTNLFARRTLALDPATPQVTGVSPNNSYVGNAPAIFTLGSQDDLEVIDAKLRLLYPNLTIGDGAGTIPAAGAGGLVWTYALSGTFMTGSGAGSAISSGPAVGVSSAFGFFNPIAKRFDNSIINPSITPLTLDLFTTNVQETCTGTTGVATGPTTAADCGVETSPVWSKFVGDPIPTDVGGFVLKIPTNVGVQVRDVFGSWIFNTVSSTIATHPTGVSDEFVSPILSATVTAPVTTYSASYYDPGLGQSCPAGGAVQAAGSPTCVTGASSINFRVDNFLTAGSTKVFRATEALSRSLPIFSRADLFGLNAQQQWVFIARIVVPTPVSVGASCPAAAPASTGVVGCDNGLERYWLYTFVSVPSGFTQYRAIGVDSHGSGLASTIHP